MLGHFSYMSFTQSVVFYDALYADKDYGGEAEYVVALAAKMGHPVRSVLDLGCGTGRHSAEWKKLGFNVYGVDANKDMVREALAKGIPCSHARIGELNLPDRFDLAVSLFHVVSYITDSRELIKSFERIWDHLVPGGLLIFDAWYSPAVFHLRAMPRVKWVESSSGTVIRIADPVERTTENIVEVQFDFFYSHQGDLSKYREQHKMRHFSIPEIRTLSTQSGFEFCGVEELLTGKEPSPDTWSVCYTLRKPYKA
jgi:SAM-dependent methyltransferase